MTKNRTLYLATTALSGILLSGTATAGAVGDLPGPGIFALLALGVVGAIGIAKLRK